MWLRVFVGGLGVAAASMLLVPVIAQDFSGQTLVVGTWGGGIEKLLRENVATPLEKETGARVEFILGGSSDRMARLYAERSNPTMDVAFLNIYEAPQALGDGVVVAPDPENSMYQDIWPGMNDGCYAMSVNALGIAYNKRLVEQVPEWADMWRPEYKGKIALAPYPSTESDGFLAIAARLAGKDEHDSDAAFNKLAELKPIALTYTNLDEIFGMMEAQEVAMAPMISGFVISSLDHYPDIDFAFPQEPGPVVVRDMLCLVKGSPNPELAQKFAEIALGVDNQQSYAEQLYFGPTNKNVTLSPELSRHLIDTPDEVESLIQLDWPYLLTQRRDWTLRWNKEILDQ